MDKRKWKKHILMLFYLILFLYGIISFMYDIFAIFSKGVGIIRGDYYEFRKNSSSTFDNQTGISGEFYVVKKGFTFQNCNKSDYMTNKKIYKYIKNGATIAFFWIAALSKLTVSTMDIYLEIKEYRADEPAQLEKNSFGEKCQQTCIYAGKGCLMLIKIIFISTTCAIPTFMMAFYDYKTPCLILKTLDGVLHNLLDSDFMIITYYINIIIISMILLVFAVKRYHPEFCSMNKSNREKSDDICRRIQIVAIIVIVIGFYTLINNFVSLFIFWHTLTIKFEGKFTAICSALTLVTATILNFSYIFSSFF